MGRGVGRGPGWGEDSLCGGGVLAEQVGAQSEHARATEARGRQLGAGRWCSSGSVSQDEGRGAGQHAAWCVSPQTLGTVFEESETELKKLGENELSDPPTKGAVAKFSCPRRCFCSREQKAIRGLGSAPESHGGPARPQGLPAASQTSR